MIAMVGPCPTGIFRIYSYLFREKDLSKQATMIVVACGAYLYNYREKKAKTKTERVSRNCWENYNYFAQTWIDAISAQLGWISSCSAAERRGRYFGHHLCNPSASLAVMFWYRCTCRGCTATACSWPSHAPLVVRGRQDRSLNCTHFNYTEAPSLGLLLSRLAFSKGLPGDQEQCRSDAG